MKCGRFYWTLIVGVLVLGGLGTQSAMALSGFYDYDFTIDNTVSSLTVTAMIDPMFGLGAKTDSDNSSVSGTIRANLNPLGGTFSQIQVHEMDMIADDDMSMSMSWNILIAGADADVQTYDLGLLLGGSGGYGTVGPATTVGAGGSFTQTGNMVQGTGTVDYLVDGWGLAGSVYEEGTRPLQDEDPQAADLVGSVLDLGSTVKLTLNVDMTIDMMEFPDVAEYLDDGYISIVGQIVAYADKPLLGDANSNGAVDVSDLGILATNYGAASGAEWLEGDFNLDGKVDVSDLGILATNYGSTAAGGPVVTPEPATMTLLGVGILALLRRRRK